MKSPAYEHLSRLVEFGPRPLGSRANLKAQEYIRRVYSEAGFMIEDQELDVPEWECRGVSLKLGGKRLSVTANDYSASCDVTATLVPLGSLAELEAAEISGQFALLYGNLAKGSGYSARKAFYYPERDGQVLSLLESKHPAAVLLVHSKPGSSEPLMRDWEFSIPSASVSAEVGLRMLKSLDDPVSLEIKTHRQPGKFRNVVAYKPGTLPARVVLLAHFDTMSNTTGAVDNASGTAVLLALAQKFAARDLQTGLEFYAVNGEEMGGVGDTVYLKAHASILPQVLVAVNVDGVGGIAGTNHLALMGASAALQESVLGVRAHFPGTFQSDPWYESDHTALLSHGVPCIPISSDGVQHNHSPLDSLDWISPVKLDEVVELVSAILEALQGKEPGWTREQTGGTS